MVVIIIKSLNKVQKLQLKCNIQLLSIEFTNPYITFIYICFLLYIFICTDMFLYTEINMAPTKKIN